MRTTFVGQEKLIVSGGRYFQHCDAAADLAVQADWAREVLARPAVTYQNGRDSHEVAGRLLDHAEDGLLEYLRVPA